MPEGPLVSVGMPVRNGGAALRDAIESILAQTHTRFELIVSDNASTDETDRVCRDYAERDRRIRYIRQPHDVGPLANFVGVLREARGEFFCWASHDDRRAPRFIERLATPLMRCPTAALAACQVAWIDGGGRRGGWLVRRGPATTVGWPVARRLRQVALQTPPTFVYGLFRTDVLRSHADVLTSRSAELRTDLLLLFSILATHDLAFVPEPLFETRLGGRSQRVDLYDSFAAFLRDYADYAGRFWRCFKLDGLSPWRRAGVRLAQLRHLWRECSAPGFRRMYWHLLTSRAPWLADGAAAWRVLGDGPWGGLRKRLRRLPRGARIVLFGGGKHTQRMWPAFARAAASHCRLVGVLDDRPSGERLHGTGTNGHAPKLVRSDDWPALRPDVVIVSSDTFEETLATRARALLPPTVPVWRIYGKPATA